jgi:hypothetical protein
MKNIQFIASLRRLLFAGRVEREIRRRILPHLHRETDHGYPFRSRDEMVESWMHAALDVQADLNLIARKALDLPQPYGDMFCYIAYRDLHERMKKYQELAEKLTQAETNDSPSVAVPA